MGLNISMPALRDLSFCPTNASQIATASEVLSLYDFDYISHGFGGKFPHRYLIVNTKIKNAMAVFAIYRQLGNRFLFEVEPIPELESNPTLITHVLCVYRKRPRQKFLLWKKSLIELTLLIIQFLALFLTVMLCISLIIGTVQSYRKRMRLKRDRSHIPFQLK